MYLVEIYKSKFSDKNKHGIKVTCRHDVVYSQIITMSATVEDINVILLALSNLYDNDIRAQEDNFFLIKQQIPSNIFNNLFDECTHLKSQNEAEKLIMTALSRAQLSLYDRKQKYKRV